MSILELYEKVLPTFMFYGMSYDEFWYGDSHLVKYYFEKHRLQVQYENQKLWLQGVYFMSALDTSLHRAFDKSSHVEYIEKPIQILPKTKEEKEQEIREGREKIIERLNALTRANKK